MMNQKVKNTTGWVLSGLISLTLAASALDKIILSAHALEIGTLLGFSPTVYRTLGVIEILSVALFLLPRTGLLGLLLISSYLGGAIATHLQHGHDVLFPAIIESIVWICAVLQFPELTQRIAGKQKG